MKYTIEHLKEMLTAPLVPPPGFGSLGYKYAKKVRTKALLAAIPELLAELEAKDKEIERLSQRTYGLKRRIHLYEQHNQYFERCESAWCNPSPDNDPAMDVRPTRPTLCTCTHERLDMDGICRGCGSDCRRG